MSMKNQRPSNPLTVQRNLKGILILSHVFLRWYVLQCKPGQKKKDYRGELEVRTSFTVKVVPENSNGEGSTQDLSNKKNKGSLQSLNKAAANLGGSLMSLGHKVSSLLTRLNPESR